MSTPVLVHVDGEPVERDWHGQTNATELKLRSGLDERELRHFDLMREVGSNGVEIVTGRVKCKSGDEFISARKTATQA